MRWLRAVAPHAWFRALVAVAFVALHVATLTQMGKTRFALPFNTEPGEAPAFADKAQALLPGIPAHWRRLVVSRWDAEHYEGLALRGFSQCPKGDMRKVDLAAIAVYCDFSFYPGYPALGYLATFGGRVPIDYALFGVSLIASVLFLFLWTSGPVRAALGTGGAYLSLVLLNAFPTAFALGTVQTEPCALAFTLGSVIAMARRRYLLAAFLAGAASGIRIGALAAAVACGVALIASLWLDRPKSRSAWAARIVALPLAGWGALLIAGFFYHYYSDPLLYVHAHEAAYAGLTSRNVWERFDSKFIFAVVGLDGMHRQEGLLLAACLLFLALGMRRAVAGFAPQARIQLWTLTLVGTAVSMVGSWPLGFLGMNRYWLMVTPLFFAMAQVLRRSPAALVLWLALSSWTYWNVDACDYLSQGEPWRCNFK